MPCVMGAIDRRQRRAPIDRREPAGVAMGQDLDRPAPALRRPGRLDQRRGRARRCARLIATSSSADRAGAGVGGGDAPLAAAASASARASPSSAQRRLTAVGRVAASVAAAASSARVGRILGASPAPCHRRPSRRSAARRAPAWRGSPAPRRRARARRAMTSSCGSRVWSMISTRAPVRREPDRAHRPAGDVHRRLTLQHPAGHRVEPGERAPGRALRAR